MTNPALRVRGQDMAIVMFDGSEAIARGVVALEETSTGESSQAFADAGPIAWLDFDGDGQQIEFLRYRDPATGQRIHRRKIKCERIGTVYPVWKVHMVRDATVLPHAAAFDRRSFSPLDFETN